MTFERGHRVPLLSNTGNDRLRSPELGRAIAGACNKEVGHWESFNILIEIEPQFLSNAFLLVSTLNPNGVFARGRGGG